MEYIQDDRPITWLHKHNYLELGYCHEGSGMYIIDGKILHYKAGDAVVINRDELHLASSARGTQSRWSFCMIDTPRLLMDLPETERSIAQTDDLCGSGFTNVVTEADDPGITRGIQELAEEIKGERPGYRILVNGLVMDLMVRLHRLVRKEVPGPEVTPATIPALAPALTYLAAHFREPCPIPALAQECSLSESHFRRQFIAGTGRTPVSYLLQLRVQNACMLLVTTEKRIIDISLESGFETLSSFNRAFKKTMKCAPREWRKSNSG